MEKDRLSSLEREGLMSEKKSSVLGIGRNELTSRGAIEAFSQSDYLHHMRRNDGWAAPRAQLRGADVDAVRNLPQ